MKRAALHMGIGMAAGLGISGVLLAAMLLLQAATTPVPYKDVHVIEQWRDGEWLHVTATFIKTDCTFQKLSVIGHELGETVALEWKDREAPEGDRLRGLQTLRINVSQVDELDRIELRTRHDCNGTVVDRTFAWLDPTQEIRPPHSQAGHGGHLEPVNAGPNPEGP